MKERNSDVEANSASSHRANSPPSQSIWTSMHSHFAAMGGFALEIKYPDRNFFPVSGPDDERPTRITVTGKGLLFLESHRPGIVSSLPRERIQDKSKGDKLANSLVCFQSESFLGKFFLP